MALALGKRSVSAAPTVRARPVSRVLPVVKAAAVAGEVPGQFEVIGGGRAATAARQWLPCHYGASAHAPSSRVALSQT